MKIVSLTAFFLVMISCNKNNVFINNEVAYLSLKEGEFFIEGDLTENLCQSKFELKRILSTQESDSLIKTINETEYHKDNVDIIDCPVEGCYVFFEGGQATRVIYYLCGGQKLAVYQEGKSKETVYVKSQINLP